MQILIVDDNITYLNQMKKYLSLYDFQVETSEKGEDALAKMTKNFYDVVILDLKMPDTTGIDILQRAQEHGVPSKFIIITGYGSVDTAVKAMKLGAVDYLQKPFEPSVLFNLIKKVRKSPPGLSTPTVAPQENLKNVFRDICKGKTALLITDQKPHTFSQKNGIEVAHSIWLTSKPVSAAIDPKKIATLRHYVQEFVSSHDKGLVIHDGLSSLLKIHGSKRVKDYLSFLHTLVEGKDFQLIIIYQSSKEKGLLQTLEKTPAFNLIDDLVKIFDHEARYRILGLLEKHKILHYSDFLKEMDINISSNLAFHLKKLMSLKVIEKRGDTYLLTPRGQHFVGILHSLNVGTYPDPTSKILYYPL